MTQRTRRLAVLGSLVATLLLGSVNLGAAPVDESETEVLEQGRTALDEWVENRRMIAKEKRDWVLGKELLEDRIDILEGEIGSLRERIDDAQDDIAETDVQREELLAQNEELKVSSDALAEIIAGLEARTKALLARVPEPLVERVRPLSQRFPDKPDETKLSLSERFANVIGVLNAMNKFNREVSVTSEVRSLSDGSSAEVATIYVGIGHAYFASPNGAAAGVGSGGEQGWTWSGANEHADAILEAIAILENEQPAAFVSLPMEVK